ncbi:MAG: hypothetical protein JRE23_10095 [Deltaproteobacteria bacterium]|nr:hypothetical protein [Deltaproteobacteria bacterium]
MDEEKVEVTKEDIKYVREFAPGYIGGKDLARKATDDEVGYLLLLNEQIARFSNTLIDIERRKRNLMKAISSRIAQKRQNGRKRGR